MITGPPFCVLEKLQGDVGTRFGIGQGVMMMEQVVAAIGGNSVQLVIGQLLEQTLGGHAGTIKFIVGIVHLVAAENSLEATLVKTLVVGNQRQPLDKGLYLCPHYREDGCVVSIFMPQPVDALAPVAVIVGLRLDEGLKGVDNAAVTYNDNTHRAHAGALAVGSLKIDGSKIPHQFSGKINGKNTAFMGQNGRLNEKSRPF